ncbi:titin isoform X12 [Oncorhynchus kisutch]|uniref:titin isoform X12 n=1 Tax=Oncorhynchus kisutch TaxID=8019 RepID=UPI0012DD72E8|nr:titin-like isoform X12 [Oncorhynchus kisutch]
MGQLLSWIRAPRDNQALQDVAVEQQPAFDCCQCFKKAPKGYQELPSESFPPELFHPSSQPRQYSPTSVAQVAVNPAQFESASASSTMATKPGAVSVTMGGATASGATAGGSPTTAGTTQRGTTKVAMPETAFVSPAGATIIDIPTPGTNGSPKDTPKPAPMHLAKATPLTTGGGNIVVEATTPWKAEVPKLQESPEQTAKSVPTTSSKVDMAKKDPAKLVTAVAAPAAAAGDASLKGPQTKVQVVPPGAKAAKEPAPMHPAKATPLTTGGGNIVGEATTPWKAEVPKLQESLEQTAKFVTAVAAPAAAAGDASLKEPQTKVQVEVVPPGAKAAKEPAPMHPAKATPLTTGGGNIVGEATTPWKAEVPKLQVSPEQTAKSVPTTSSKVDMAKKDPAKLVTAVAAPAAAAGDASLKGPQTKVQVEIVPPGAKAAKKELAVDPFDALADSLPSSESFAPAAHVYTGPEVIEHGLSSKKAVICGGNDCPLPPGYRFEDMAPVADVKPKDAPKPMSTDEALDSLSFGFTTSMPPIPQKQEKKVEDLAAIDALSAGFSNFAPPPPAPIKKAEQFKSAPVTKSPAPPVDKKSKVEKFADDFSLMSGLDSPLATKPKTDEKVEDLAAVDALSAGFSNFTPLPPAPIKKAEEFKSAPVTKCPAPLVDKKANVEKKPMSTDEALDSLSFGFTTSMHPIPQKQEKKVEDLAAIDALSAGFSNFAPPPPAPIKKAEEFKSAPVTKSPAPPIDKKSKVEKFADDSSLMSGLDSPLDTKPKTDGVQVEVVPPGAKAAKEPAPMHPAKATPLTTGGGNIVGEVTTPWKAEVPKLQVSPEQTAKSVPTTSSKVDMAKKDPAKLVTAVAAPAAAAGDASLKGPQTKVQVEVVPPGAKAAKKELAVDPFDALADSLPSSESFAPAAHVYTGPEVIEHGLSSKKGVICGGNDCPLPPGYRFEDMSPVADVKPKDVPKPMSTDEALDSLSFGFTTSMPPIPQKQEKKVEDLAAIDALSAGFSNFAPPPPAPIKKAEEFKSAPVTKSPAPPIDKKAKVEKFADDFSLMSGLDSPLATKPKTDESVPTTSSKVDMAKKDPAKLVTAVAAPAAAAGDASLKGPQTKKVEDLAAVDALSAGFSNFTPLPPAPIKKAEEFKSAPVTKCPAPLVDKKSNVEKKPMSTDEALDSLSFGFTTSMPPIPQKQEKKVEDLAAIDALSAGFSNFAPPPPAPIKKAEEFKSAPVTKSPAPPVDKKSKVEKKPMSTDEALDSLSFGFTTSMPPIPQKQEKKVEDLAAIDALSAGFSNFAPPPPAPIKKAEEFKSAPVTKSPAPPVDKKSKVEKFADDFSLMSGLDSPLATKPKTDESVPTTSSKVDMAKKDPAKLVTAVAAPAAAAGDASLKGPQTKVQVVPPVDKAAKEPAPMHPAKATPLTTGGGNIVGEATTPWKAEVPKLQVSPEQTAKSVPTTSSKVDMAKKDPAKLVTAVAAPAAAAGDASLKGPQTKKVEDLAAVDALSAGFSNFTPLPPAPIKKAEEFKSAPVTKCPAPPVDKKANVEKFADDFSLMSGLDSPLTTKPKTDGGGSMSLDALSALGDSLPAPDPAPEPPKIRHEDIVTEGKLTSKKGVFVGERDDTLPPKYRFTENKVKDLPPLKPEPSMDSGEALEILSGDFMSSCVAPAVHAPVLCPPASPTQASDDFALDALAGDFVAPAVAPAVKSAVDRQLSRGTVDALDTLSDSLMDKAPIPEPAPVSVRDIVKEKKVVEEKLTKVGERDDSLPAEYRPTEKDRKANAEAKVQADVRPKQPSMDDSEALDLLSRDLSSSTGPAAASVAVTTEQRQPRLEPMSAPVLDDLAGTLLPDTPEFKSKGDKPKSKSRSKSKKQRKEDPSSIDHLSGQLSSDVVSASTNKDGKS